MLMGLPATNRCLSYALSCCVADRSSKTKIYIIPGKDSIQYAPELFQGRWWKRADLTLYFNVLISVESIVKAIEEVNVTIKANEPGTSDVILEPGEIIIKKG